MTVREAQERELRVVGRTESKIEEGAETKGRSDVEGSMPGG